MIVPALKELKNVYWLHSNQAERAKFMMISKLKKLFTLHDLYKIISVLLVTCTVDLGRFGVQGVMHNFRVCKAVVDAHPVLCFLQGVVEMNTYNTETFLY